MKTKKRILLIISLIILLIIATIAFWKLYYRHNEQLNINIFHELKVYKFEEGNGFIGYKASNSQKKAIWSLIDNMAPCEKINITPSFGGFASFYFINDNVKTVFYLREIANDKLYVVVDKYDKTDNISNVFYYTSIIQYAENIKDVIVLD